MAQKQKADFSRPVPAPRRKLKKEIPVSEMPSALDNFELWITANWKLAVTLLVVIVVAGVGVIVAGFALAEADAKTRTELADAATVADLERVIAAHPDHPAVWTAGKKLSALYQEQKDYAKAYDTLMKVVNHPGLELFVRTRAAIDCAGILELQNNFADAAQEYEKIATNMTLNDTQRAEAAYAAARIAAANGDKQKAGQLLEIINVSRAWSNPNDPYAVWAQKAITLKESLTAPAPAPAAATANAVGAKPAPAPGPEKSPAPARK